MVDLEQQLCSQRALRFPLSHFLVVIAMLRTTDLYVYSDAGIITDAFVPWNIEALRMLDLARRLGVRTAILGHMIGTAKNESLR